MGRFARRPPFLAVVINVTQESLVRGFARARSLLCGGGGGTSANGKSGTDALAACVRSQPAPNALSTLVRRGSQKGSSPLSGRARDQPARPTSPRRLSAGRGAPSAAGPFHATEIPRSPTREKPFTCCAGSVHRSVLQRHTVLAVVCLNKRTLPRSLPLRLLFVHCGSGRGDSFNRPLPFLTQQVTSQRSR